MIPGSISSAFPPTLVAITGRPEAIASRIVFEMPSASEGRTKQSRPRISSGTSARSPGSHARWRASPSSRIRSTSPRSLPSPATTSRSRSRAAGACRSACHECTREIRLVLHRFEPAHGADEPQARIVEGRALDRRTVGLARSEARRVDAVVDLRHAPGVDADALDEVALEIAGHGDVLRDERAVQPAHELIALARTVQVADVAPVLAVDAHGDAREPRRHGRLERREVARVHDRRAPVADQPVKTREQLRRMPGPLAEREQLDARAPNALRKTGVDARQRDDGVPPRIVRQAVDEIDDAVLQPADREPVDDVQHQRAGVGRAHRRLRAAASIASIAGECVCHEARAASRRRRARRATCGA